MSRRLGEQRVGPRRRRCAVAVIGGPTTLLDLGGHRVLVDPTFDPPGEHGYLTKTEGPAVDPGELGLVDVVLVSHDRHSDNLDESGRAVALAAPLVLSGPETAGRLGSAARGLAPWESTTVPGRGPDTPLAVRAVPAVHGPADGARDAGGHVNCEVTGFVLSGAGLPTVYVSGDNASLGAVADIAGRAGPIDVAVLFVGAARVPGKERGRPLTLTAARAAAAAEVLGAPVVVTAHQDSWAHFTEGIAEVETAFDDAGIAAVLRGALPGRWISLEDTPGRGEPDSTPVSAGGGGLPRPPLTGVRRSGPRRRR